MMMATISIILACTPIRDILAHYYSPQSFRIAAVDSVCEDGFDRQLGYNRIARANYKHRNYLRGYQIAQKIELETRDQLYYDTISLRALLAKNIGRFNEADSLYGVLFSSDVQVDSILFEAHLNYADLFRIQLDYQARQEQLFAALAYAKGWQRNKVIRVIARHYFAVLRDFERAETMLEQHTEPINDEGRAGWLLVQAEIAEAKEQYRIAMQYYRQSQLVAKKSGFVVPMLNASDGYMRANIMLMRAGDQRLQFFIINVLLLAIFFMVWWYNQYYRNEVD